MYLRGRRAQLCFPYANDEIGIPADSNYVGGTTPLQKAVQVLRLLLVVHGYCLVNQRDKDDLLRAARCWLSAPAL